MPRDVTAADVERALAMCPDEWRWGKDWDAQDREDMRDTLEADDLIDAIQIWMPCGERESRLILADIRLAHAQGWPEDVEAAIRAELDQYEYQTPARLVGQSEEVPVEDVIREALDEELAKPARGLAEYLDERYAEEEAARAAGEVQA